MILRPELHPAYWIEKSKALESSFEPPAPDGLSYYPFQKASAEYALHRESVLFADEMGLGKTEQLIAYINCHREYLNKILIVCQDNMKINLERRLQEWMIRPYRIRYMTSTRKWKNDFDILIVNYDLLWKLDSHIKSIEWDLAAFDEIHYLKEEKSRRTKCVLGSKSKKKDAVQIWPLTAKRRVGLTGTPMRNGKPKELIPVLRALGVFTDIFDSWWKYVHRYCNAHYEEVPQRGSFKNGRWLKGETKKVLNIDGASNLDELYDKLRTYVMVRRMKSECMPWLPKKIRTVIEISGQNATVAQEQRKLKKMGIDPSIMECCSDEDFERHLEKMSSGASIAFDKMSSERKELGLAKIPFAVKQIEDLLEGTDEKIVVFAWTREVVEKISEVFDCPKIYGGTTATKAQEAIDKIQNDPECRLVVLQIQSGGTGHTITAATICLFIEYAWVPGDMQQAEDRIHRIGSTADAVNYYYLAFKGSMDATMGHTLARKARINRKVLNRNGESTYC